MNVLLVEHTSLGFVLFHSFKTGKRPSQLQSGDDQHVFALHEHATNRMICDFNDICHTRRSQRVLFSYAELGYESNRSEEFERNDVIGLGRELL